MAQCHLSQKLAQKRVPHAGSQTKTGGIADKPSTKINQDIAKEVKQAASKTAEGKRYSGTGEQAQGTGSKEADKKRSSETGRLISGCPGYEEDGREASCRACWYGKSSLRSMCGGGTGR